MTNICFVGCVKSKQNYDVAATKMYTSPYFLKSKNYAIQNFHRWYILSARYGLVEPNRMISPYDLTLNKMRVVARCEWADRVILEILRKTSPVDELTFLTGERYHEFLVGTLRDNGYTVHIPMQGLRFGEKLQWLQQQISEDINE